MTRKARFSTITVNKKEKKKYGLTMYNMTGPTLSREEHIQIQYND